MNSDMSHIEHESHNGESERIHSSEPEHQDEHNEILLPIVEPLFAEEVPTDVARIIAESLEQDESIFVLLQLSASHTFETTSGKTEKAPFWTVITGTRLLLIAVSSEGQTFSDIFNQQTEVEFQNGFGRDALKIADKSLSTGIWEGRRWLFKEAIKLFPLPEYEKYLYIANLYLEKGQELEAIPFLRQSLECVPTIKAYLLLSNILIRNEKQEEALTVLTDALKIAEAASLIEEVQLYFPENIELLLYLAAVCEGQHLWDACIDIYQRLVQKTPDFDLYFLKLGEMYNAKQDYRAAFDHYQKFITLRTASEKFQRGELIQWDLSDFKWFSADPDLVKAYFDLGVIYEYELDELEKAALIYLALLRHAPFYTEAYKHFWVVYQQIHDKPDNLFKHLPISISTFLQIYKLLIPEMYSSIVTTGHIPKDVDPTMTSTPITYHKLDEQDHEILIHPGEKEYVRRIQNWLTNLVVSEDEKEGIEEYCEQVSASNFPEIFRTIEQIADFLGIEPPKCFISRGKIGISVRNTDLPFIFIGSEHLNEDNERYFTKDELVFIIAAQLEHIKSGHLLITGTELWKSLGTASFDSFLVALQCLPVGSFLGKITHQFATAGLKKVYKMTKYSGIQKILDFFHKGGSERDSEDGSEIQEDTTKSERTKTKKPPKPETLLKEQIVDFARHAVYTADRTGLLACNDIHAACSAIFKLAGNTCDELEHVEINGLFDVLGSLDNRGNFLYLEYAKRFSELIKFALSEDYWRLHSKNLIIAENVAQAEETPVWDTSEYHIFINKLQILENSMQNELFTPEEFLRKQKNLVRDSGLLTEEDLALIDKLQQAFLDEILTTEELHNKLFTLLETRHEAKDESIKEE